MNKDQPFSANEGKSICDNSNPQQGSSSSTVPKSSSDHVVRTKTSPSSPGTSMGYSKARFRIPSTKRDHRKLFVGGLSSEVTNQYFKSFFAEYGSILDSIVMIDRETKCSRGFGFVTFEDPIVANKVLESNMKADSKSKVYIAGKWCEVKPSEPKRHRSSAYSSSGNSEKVVGRNHSDSSVDAKRILLSTPSPKGGKQGGLHHNSMSPDDEMTQDVHFPGNTDQYYYNDHHYHQQNPNAYFYPQYMPNNVSPTSLTHPQMAYNLYQNPYHHPYGAPPALMSPGPVFYNNQNAMMHAATPTNGHLDYGNFYPQNVPPQAAEGEKNCSGMLIQEEQHQVSN